MAVITQDTLISEVLSINPDAAPLFIEMGMHCLGCAMAAGESVGEACDVHGVNTDELLAKLNAFLA